LDEAQSLLLVLWSPPATGHAGHFFHEAFGDGLGHVGPAVLDAGVRHSQCQLYHLGVRVLELMKDGLDYLRSMSRVVSEKETENMKALLAQHLIDVHNSIPMN
jgi:hypothetical protein